MGRYITTTGTALPVLREVSTTYNAVVGDRILCNSTSGAFNITLPLNTTLVVGDVIQIIDATGTFATNNVTVQRNGALIQGTTETLVCDVANSVITLLFTGNTYGWVVTSS